MGVSPRKRRRHWVATSGVTTPAPTPTPTPTPVPTPTPTPGPAPASQTIAYFDDAIYNVPVYNTATGPANVHKASVNKSFMVTTRQNAAVAIDRRELCVQVYDEATNVASEPLFAMLDISTTTGQLDTHGVGALCLDQFGNLHLFGGGHGDNMRHSVSTDNGATWRQDPSINGQFTYAKPVMVGTSMYLFMRDETSSSRKNLVYYKSETISANGTINWGEKFNIVDMGTDSRSYTGDVLVRGTDIFISMTRANYSDTVRRGIYCFVFNTTTGAVRNLTSAVSSATLPITEIASYLLFDQTTTEGTNPAAIFGPNGNYHLLFIDVADRASATRGSFLHREYNPTTGAQVSAATIAPCNYSSRFNAQFTANGIEAMWTDTSTVLFNGSTPYASGGDVLHASRPDGGAWAAPVTIQQPDKLHALFGPTRVFGAPVTSKLRWMYYERADDDTTFRGGDLGNCRAYGWGPQGKVTPVYNEHPDATAFINFAIVNGSTPPSIAWRKVYHSLARQWARLGMKGKTDFLRVTAAHDEAAGKTEFYTGLLATTVGSYTWAGAGQGFVPDGTTFKLKTGFNPSTGTPKMAQDSALVGVYCLDAGTGNFAIADDAPAVADVRLSINPRNASGNRSVRLNDTTSLTRSGFTSSRTLAMVIRNTAAGKRVWTNDNAFATTDAAASVGMPQNEITLYGGGTQFDSRKQAVSFITAFPGADNFGLLIASAMRRFLYDMEAVAA